MDPLTEDSKNITIEQYEYGHSREWLNVSDTYRIAIINGSGNMARASIDVWADVVIDTLNNWSWEAYPLHILLDLSTKGQGITPYSRERAEGVYKFIPPKSTGYAAIVIPDGPINRLVSLFFVRRRIDRGINVQERVFTRREDALNWLREKIANTIAK